MKNIGFAGLILLLAATGAQADPRDDALLAIERCSGVGDKAQRLVCYDSAAVQVPGALSAPLAQSAPAPRLVQRQRSGGFFSKLLGIAPRRRPQTTVAQFGSEGIASGGDVAFPIAISGDTVNQISAHVTAYEFAAGYVALTLDNGQVWRQTQDGLPLGHLSRPARSYMAVIGRGTSTDSYAMTLSGLAGSIAVRRSQ